MGMEQIGPAADLAIFHVMPTAAARLVYARVIPLTASWRTERLLALENVRGFRSCECQLTR